MIKKIIFVVVILGIIGAVAFFAMGNSSGDDQGFQTFEAKKGDIIDKALAIGQIEPKKEIAVKAKISGIVKKMYVNVGDLVHVGDRLLDIAPDPTPIEFAEASRQVEIYQVAYNNAKREYDRSQSLIEKELISTQDHDSKKAVFDEADLRLKLAREKLSLIESGKTEIADMKVDNTVRAQSDGTVLSRLVEEGDPVVPLTSYQAGTELMTLAYMDDLLFKGTIDEIDVGKIKPGMESVIKVGALPRDTIRGVVERISPKAHQDQGSTVFDVEITLIERGEAYLRAGYSANADIIINKRENILVIPERLISFRADSAFVEVQDSLGTIDSIDISTGLSDGINIEVTEGLSEGDMLVERPPRTIQ